MRTKTDQNIKPRAFWFHYNKPLSAKRKKPVLTIHYAGACHFVESIETVECDVSTRVRRLQPRCVLVGKGIVEIKSKRAIIYGSLAAKERYVSCDKTENRTR
jgi:hypothetical protein